MPGVATVHVQIHASAASVRRAPALYGRPVVVQLFLAPPGADRVNGQVNGRENCTPTVEFYCAHKFYSTILLVECRAKRACWMWLRSCVHTART